MIDNTYAIYAKNKTKLLWLIVLGKSVMKTRQDNDVTHRIGLVYVEKDTEHSGPMWPSVVYDKNQIGQRRDRLYRCDLCWN